MTDKGWQVRDSSQGYLEFRASLSIRSEFRAALESLKYGGHGIEWLEQNGWFYSLFVVRGHPILLAAIQKAIIRKWAFRSSNVHLKQYKRGANLDQLA